MIMQSSKLQVSPQKHPEVNRDQLQEVLPAPVQNLIAKLPVIVTSSTTNVEGKDNAVLFTAPVGTITYKYVQS